MTAKAFRWRRIVAGCLLLAVVGMGMLIGLSHAAGPLAVAEREVPMTTRVEGAIAAPEFPAGMDWLNTDRPLSLKELRGKVVLLDFWTYCCINCMHVIPDLKRLERQFPGELVVVGVHSAKFTSEQQTDNIRQAILRYEIEHPVLNDGDMRVWREYGVNSWPTLVLIDPAGKIVGSKSGEGAYDAFAGPIAAVIKAFDAKGQIDRKPLKLKLERDKAPPSVLSFPGKVLADEKSGRLFIADSNHNRVVVAALADGAVKEVIGGGRQGLKDGGFAAAEFHHPQGMALDGDKLYIADTENHAIRVADLDGKTVSTLAGTGRQAQFPSQGGEGRSTPLNSPWDLTLQGGVLYVAMAGSHQIWRLDLATGRAEPCAGSGREARSDGSLASAALAQPSGIVGDGRKLYFADSEDSSVRSADLGGGRVETIVGGDLFDFGDRDGKGLAVRLQHPLGIAYHDGTLYVADTYNNKIKKVSPAERTAQSWLGTGDKGMADGAKATFNEPGGLSVAGGKLYIADTNNHLIRVADLKTGDVQTLRLKDMDKLRPATAPADQPAGETITLQPQTIRPGQARLKIQLSLPAEHKLTEGAPTSAAVRSADVKVASFGGKDAQQAATAAFPLELPLAASPGKTELAVTINVYYCRTGKESLCFFKDARLVLPIIVREGASGDTLEVSYSPAGQ